MLIRSKRVWVANKFLACIVSVKEDKIEKILPYDADVKVDYDFGNDRVVPGFIDVHTHGAVKYDTLDADEQGLKRWAKYLPSEGVVAFLPTTVTQTEEVLVKASKSVANVVRENDYEGARILGINFEGPFLDVAYKGAQPEQCIVKPDIEQFYRFQEAADGLIKIITMSLNKDEDYKMTRELASQDIIVSIGHGGTTYEEAILGFANGARLMTHTFNGMTGLHQRMPGQVGASMRVRDEFAEIICDGIHIHPDVMNTYFKSKGPDYAVMVSDSISAKAVDPNDEFYLGGERVYIHPDGSARRANGGLSGSTAKIIQGLKTCVVDAEIPFSYAINSCTINPARLLRIDDRKGKIKANYDADLVVIDDNYEIVKTMVLGKFLYSRD
ncbi:N-acetylglucosamine-6-phosphate deacetylase [Oceanivirga miroungae]|uniref:N-acetylglucosamine-6-phosphate deacetylase n=1 Tax=Oceanivirga miroungae TaxID=1130046 RepID=A0A6I8M683_9FUSO|nr:N-acetylglucosamine-6-phosphate deacetylase [Oceanivirga miroungae]VWL85399.1 N-acetylglucosamine-6-phosphate deacetylase [Oceanivirga miroungae]